METTDKSKKTVESGLPIMQDRQAQKAYLRTMKDRMTALKDV